MSRYLTEARHFFTVLVLLGASACVRFQPQPLAPDQARATFESRSLADPGLREFLSASLRRDFPAWPLTEWDFDLLAQAALYFHPGVEVSRAQYQAAVAGVLTAGGRPNPTMTVTPEYNFSAVNPVSPWLPAVTWDLPIETAGKRGHRLNRARQLAEVAAYGLTTAIWQIRMNLRAASIDFLASEERAALIQTQSARQAEVVRLLEARFQAGEIAGVELAAPRNALNKIKVDLIDLGRQRIEAQSRLASAIGVPAQALEGLSLRGGFGGAGLNVASWKSAELVSIALRHRTDLLALLAEYAAAQAALQLEIARQYPDIHLGTGYQWDQGEHKWSLGLTMELPILNHNQGPIAEAQARRTEVQARFFALQSKIIGEIEGGFRSLSFFAGQIEATDAMLRLNEERAGSLQAAFEKGEADRLDLALTGLELDNLKLQALEIRIKQKQALDAMENILQCPLEDWPLADQTRLNPKPQAPK